jgi:hypothetical protein
VIVTPEAEDIKHLQNNAEGIFGIVFTDEEVVKLFKEDHWFACCWAKDGDDDGDEVLTHHLWEILLDKESPAHPSFLKVEHLEEIRAAASAAGYTLTDRPKTLKEEREERNAK